MDHGSIAQIQRVKLLIYFGCVCWGGVRKWRGCVLFFILAVEIDGYMLQPISVPINRSSCDLSALKFRLRRTWSFIDST